MFRASSAHLQEDTAINYQLDALIIIYS